MKYVVKANEWSTKKEEDILPHEPLLGYNFFAGFLKDGREYVFLSEENFKDYIPIWIWAYAWRYYYFLDNFFSMIKWIDPDESFERNQRDINNHHIEKTKYQNRIHLFLYLFLNQSLEKEDENYQRLYRLLSANGKRVKTGNMIKDGKIHQYNFVKEYNKIEGAQGFFIDLDKEEMRIYDTLDKKPFVINDYNDIELINKTFDALNIDAYKRSSDYFFVKARKEFNANVDHAFIL